MDSTVQGNKARGLQLLSSRGFAVPAFFVVTADDPLEEAGVWLRAMSLASVTMDGRGAAALAVRSSAPGEDGADQSAAGQFSSLLGWFDPGDLVLAVKNVQASGGESAIPVIVQVAVDPRISGVAFSCDPVSYERSPYLVSWTAGTSQDLVAGREDGSLLVARSAEDVDGHWPSEHKSLAVLISALETMQAELGRPADIEWAIDKAGELWLLQVRPVVLPAPQRADAQLASDLALLPSVVAGHSKVRLRAATARAGVQMSRAVILTTSADHPSPALPASIPSAAAAGLSVVLLHPCLAQSKVQREFAQVDGFDVPFFTLGCRRYAIRRYPPSGNAAVIAEEVLHRGLAESWLASVVVQEIYDAAATGIVRCLDGDYVAELALGHFVPKGVVDPSRFVVSGSGQVLESHRVHQDVAYRFINGHVVTERPVEEQLMLTDADVAKAILDVAPMFAEYPEAALEFGVLENRTGQIHGYVIDMAESDSQAGAGSLDRQLIRDGVLSPGRTEGRALRVANAEDGELDAHLLEHFDNADQPISDTVLVADRASIDLLPIVSRCSRNTAFVFRHGSLLAHLCIVLRERGIPAVIIDDDNLFGKLRSGKLVTVEAADPEWSGPRVS